MVRELGVRVHFLSRLAVCVRKTGVCREVDARCLTLFRFRQKFFQGCRRVFHCFWSDVQRADFGGGEAEFEVAEGAFKDGHEAACAGFFVPRQCGEAGPSELKGTEGLLAKHRVHGMDSPRKSDGSASHPYPGVSLGAAAPGAERNQEALEALRTEESYLH